MIWTGLMDLALHCGMDQAGFFEGTMSDVQAEYVV
jgi:hypothetical protein